MGEILTIQGNNIRNQLQMEGTTIVPPILIGNSSKIPNVRFPSPDQHLLCFGGLYDANEPTCEAKHHRTGQYKLR